MVEGGGGRIIHPVPHASMSSVWSSNQCTSKYMFYGLLVLSTLKVLTESDFNENESRELFKSIRLSSLLPFFLLLFFMLFPPLPCSSF